MSNLQRLAAWLFPDRRPDWEKAREREFIAALNGLKTLSTTDRGGMSIDPEELREQIVASREQLKHLVHNPRTPIKSFKGDPNAQVENGTSPLETPVGAMDCIEVVIWRRLPSGAAVRYVCLKSTSTGRFAAVTASLLSGGTDSLPPWVDVNLNRQAASALQLAELRWFTTEIEAINAWDAKHL